MITLCLYLSVEIFTDQRFVTFSETNMFSVVAKLVFLLVFAKHLSCGQQFVRYQSQEYFIEKNNPVKSYSEAEKICRNKNAKLVVINSQKIQDFLFEKINLSHLQSNFLFQFSVGMILQQSMYMFCIESVNIVAEGLKRYFMALITKWSSLQTLSGTCGVVLAMKKCLNKNSFGWQILTKTNLSEAKTSNLSAMIKFVNSKAGAQLSCA